MKLTTYQITTFQKTIWRHYHAHPRPMPWRQNPTPYHVLISEIMLQQTQVNRVIPKYNQFIKQFPTTHTLAAAPLSEVLRAWNGLGYNRRAKYLWQTAQAIVAQHGGTIPTKREELITLPGIGKNTAGAILAYAHQQPVPFVETNIRTVYLHHFFPGQTNISDTQIISLVQQTLDTKNPREWYWALMDYGTHLKQTVKNIHHSRHYTKQSSFQGSRRQIRGQILRLLLNGQQKISAIQSQINDPRLPGIINDLITEQLIRQTNDLLQLTDLP